MAVGGGITDKPEIEALAFEIADSCARADLECNVEIVSFEGDRWYDLAGKTTDDSDLLRQSIRYLELRGQLVRKAGNPNHVRHVEHAPEVVEC